MESNKVGRPTKYDEKYNEQAYKLCLLGYSDSELGNFFEVTESTINNWKVEYPEFLESINKAKDLADANVAEGLYKRAKGYKTKEVVTAAFQGVITDIREITKEYPPDPQAARLWLMNRQSKKWRDKQEIDHTTNGEALQPPIINVIKPV